MLIQIKYVLIDLNVPFEGYCLILFQQYLHNKKIIFSIGDLAYNLMQKGMVYVRGTGYQNDLGFSSFTL